MTYDPNNPGLILRPASNYDSLGRISPYIRIHYDTIIIRGKSTGTPFPTDPSVGDIWYDIATDKTWVYIQLSSPHTTINEWVEAPF